MHKYTLFLIFLLLPSNPLVSMDNKINPEACQEYVERHAALIFTAILVSFFCGPSAYQYIKESCSRIKEYLIRWAYNIQHNHYLSATINRTCFAIFFSLHTQKVLYFLAIKSIREK